MKDRRQAPRETRRIHLVFWDRQTPEDRRIGFTSDASLTGVFVQTNRPLRSGTRIQMEFDLSPGSFYVEGLIVRSVFVPPDLRKLKPGGMGVRLLGIDALLHDLEAKDAAVSRPTPPLPRSTQSLEELAAGEEEAAAAEQPAAPARPARRTVFERDTTSEADPARLHPAASRMRREDETGDDAKPATATATAAAATASRFAVAFESFDALRAAYERELKLGGLFVPTEAPAAIGSTITVTLQLPLGRGSIDASARVVQTLPRDNAAGAGMGIVIEDADGLAADLREILESA